MTVQKTSLFLRLPVPAMSKQPVWEKYEYPHAACYLFPENVKSAIIMIYILLAWRR